MTSAVRADGVLSEGAVRSLLDRYMSIYRDGRIDTALQYQLASEYLAQDYMDTTQLQVVIKQGEEAASLPSQLVIMNRAEILEGIKGDDEVSQLRHQYDIHHIAIDPSGKKATVAYSERLVGIKKETAPSGQIVDVPLLVEQACRLRLVYHQETALKIKGSNCNMRMIIEPEIRDAKGA